MENKGFSSKGNWGGRRSAMTGDARAAQAVEGK